MSLKSTLLGLLPAAPKTTEELRDVASKAATLTYQIETLSAERESAVEAVKVPFDSQIIQAEKTLDSLVAKLKAWALGHRADFGNRKSYEVAGHALTFRTSPGKLEYTAKDEDIIDAVVACGDTDLIETVVTVKPTLDKKAIKAALEGGNPVLVAKLSAFGFRIEKPEAFTFEPSRVGS